MMEEGCSSLRQGEGATGVALGAKGWDGDALKESIIQTSQPKPTHSLAAFWTTKIMFSVAFAL